jgi:signal transduction histidine kinase
MVFATVDDGFLRSLFGIRGLDGAREFASSTAILTPLFGRGESIGAVLILSTAPHRPYDQDDLDLAEELGRRTAIAIENARLYRAAQEANRAKADFLAIMSHELRTPLNAIMGYADLLDAEVSGPLRPNQRKQLWRVRASASHLLQLIDEILGFARMEAGVAEVRLQRVAGADLAQEAAAVIEPVATAKGLELRVDAPDRSTVIETDAGKARQILVNLLSNAVKFTKAGVVEVAFRAEEGRAKFIVRDTGIGIPRDQIERIFDPFWQVERPTTRRFGGTGLGLSVSRRFARLLRGELVVGSEPGRGTTVTLELPLGREPDPRAN